MFKLIGIVFLDFCQTRCEARALAVFMVISIALVRVEDGAGLIAIMDPPEVAGVPAFHRYEIR